MTTTSDLAVAIAESVPKVKTRITGTPRWARCPPEGSPTGPQSQNRNHSAGTLEHVTDKSEAKQALRTIARCVLPYCDPLTRRRVRCVARALIAPGPWAADNANSNEVAQLALLRLLWLQREAHDAARRGMFESTALLTRAAIDTCIVGLYCLAVPDAAERLNKVNASNLEAMMKYLPASFFDPETRAALVRLIDTPTKSPNTFDMAAEVDKAEGDDQTEKLYRAYYAPLSSLYAHGGGLALLRHTKNDEIRDEPSKWWLQSSALHIVDSCVGLLAGRLAPTRDAESAVFDAYYEAHRGRTITPLFTMAGTNAGSAIDWRAVPTAALAFVRLKRYLVSDQAARDDDLTRRQTVYKLVERCFAITQASSDPEFLRLSVEGAVKPLFGDPPST